MAATVTPLRDQERPVDWYGLTSDEACGRLAVDPAVGLSSAEVEERRARYGPNKLAEEAKAGCPVSKALAATEITLDATLV